MMFIVLSFILLTLQILWHRYRVFLATNLTSASNNEITEINYSISLSTILIPLILQQLLIINYLCILKKQILRFII